VSGASSSGVNAGSVGIIGGNATASTGGHASIQAANGASGGNEKLRAGSTAAGVGGQIGMHSGGINTKGASGSVGVGSAISDTSTGRVKVATEEAASRSGQPCR
jgi:hypothetical protein